MLLLYDNSDRTKTESKLIHNQTKKRFKIFLIRIRIIIFFNFNEQYKGANLFI